MALGLSVGCLAFSGCGSNGERATSDLRWSPNGAAIALTKGAYGGTAPQGSGWNAAIYVRRDHGKEEKLVNGGCASWSPDGRRLAFLEDKSGKYTIATTTAYGTSRGVETGLRGLRWYTCPEWWPDGRIAAVDTYDDRVEVAVAVRGRFVMKKLPIYATSTDPPAENPDKTRIVFATYNPSDIVVSDPSGSHRRTLFRRSSGYLVWPVWSPDGRRISFGEWLPSNTAQTAGTWETWVMNADGSHRTRLARSTWRGPIEADWPAVWSPNGRLIAVTEFTGGSSWRIALLKSPRP